jgi:two-component system, NarL family, response regulator NreC
VATAQRFSRGAIFATIDGGVGVGVGVLQAEAAMAPIELVLVDDHFVLRAGLRALLEKQPDFLVVGEAGTGDEALSVVRQARPRVVLMDLAMPGNGGLEATRRIVALGLGIRVLVLTALPEEQQVCDALEAGASGFVRKTAPIEELTRAIRTVASDRLFLDEDAARVVVLQRYRRAGQMEDDKMVAERLNGRERQVLALLALGHSSREIAQALSVSPKTVDAYRARLKDRLGFTGRPELVRFALRTGLLAEP